ncbi:hypothetical protein PVAND_010022 [Polypedilum vanderplanki]|uniref:Aminopeptidase n=1 Tax=Polypedilum vanderplanki TaxID=319348 RepID=A0A9J6CFF5_POLVA|nr:hypothetical protein PVAND_010022 [Polypedilum vanderplanki]
MWKFLIKILFIGLFVSFSTSDDFQNFKETKIRKTESSAIQSSETLTYRLPNNSFPLAYDIILKTDIDKGEFAFTGKVKIHVKVIEATDKITLHYKQIEIDTINLLQNDSLTLISSNLQFSLIQSHSFLIISLPFVYQSDSEFVLEVSYHGELRDDAAGFYRANYTTGDGNVIWFATTQFEIHDARHAMPCYDEPAIRAPMALTIVHGKNYSAVANMEVDEVHEIDAEYVETKFKPTPSMQTYLLAFLVSDFESIDAIDSRIPQKIYAKPMSIRNNEANFSANVVGPILRAHENHLGINYPLNKMDHAAITQFTFGAMENFGLITYLERALLLNPNTSADFAEASKFLIIRIIAHEYAHQYFGNIVSPQWWSYTFLNEGLATLFEVLIPNMLYPEMKFMDRFVTHNMPQAFLADSINAWSMSHYTEHPDELWTKFNNIGYEKSGCIMRMFQEVLTPQTFAKGLNLYLNDMYFKAATPDDLHRNLQAVYDVDFPSNSLDIGEAMLTWENQAGYPLITVQIYDNHFILTQRRYPVSNGEIYAVPITIATKTRHDFNKKTPKVWLTTENAAFSHSEFEFNVTNDDWIILNIQQIGYYRIDYDINLWHSIIAQLIESPETINSINRAVLQDEIYLAWSELNRVKADDVLNILSYFDRENEPIAWSKAQTTIATLNNRLFGTEIYEKFLNYLINITTSHVKELGYDRITDESSTISSLRSSTKSWNCIALDENCLNHELKKLRDYLTLPSASAAFDYCHGLRLIDVKTFYNLTQAVQFNESFENRENFLNNLGCTLNEENLKLLLNISISVNNKLSLADRSNLLINTMGRSVVALNLTLDFLISNFNLVNMRIPSSFKTILSSMASYINVQPHIEKTEELLTILLRDTIIDKNDAINVRNIYLKNIKWQIDNYDDIEKWFAINSGKKLMISIGIIVICNFVSFLRRFL